MSEVDHRFCVAPMMERTDRHDRMFLRQFSRRALLYTEMVGAAALVHSSQRGDVHRLLFHNPAEQPLALQLGGCDPVQLAEAAALGAGAGYREVNLNVGCPSRRVQAARFGACLMAEPRLVAECVQAMQSAVADATAAEVGAAEAAAADAGAETDAAVPVTVKCRIGIDEQDDEAFLFRFMEEVAAAGCRVFIIHARKAALRGLSPKQNREVPPLNYGRVLAAKKRFPELCIVINGGITDLQQAATLLEQGADGVMLGRAAYDNPYLLHQVDREIFGESEGEGDDEADGAAAEPRSRRQYLEGFVPYIERELARGTPLHHITRHTLGLFKGVAGGRGYRRHLSTYANRPGAGVSVLREAMAMVG